VDLAPEFPVLDGDSGKTAGVAVFFATRSRSLSDRNSFLHLRQAFRPASRARCLYICFEESLNYLMAVNKH
jgi:hypothetical protein